MVVSFDASTIEQLGKRLNEPAWLTELRRTAWAAHAGLPWPHPSDDIWRRTDVSLLNPLTEFAPVTPSLLQSVRLTEPQLERLILPLGEEQLVVRANGQWLTPPPAVRPGGPRIAGGDVAFGKTAGGGVTPPPDEAAGIRIEDLAQAARARPSLLRRILESGGLTEAEQKLSSLNAAFHHDGLCVAVPPGFAAEHPLRLVRFFAVSERQALFPVTVITVGAGSTVTIIDEYISASGDGSDGAHVVNGRIELVVEPDASVHYVRLQRWDAGAREFLLQRATLARGSTLTMANLTLGAALSKTHIITRLAGEGASAKLHGFVFGHGTQHVDQHTLQDHQAPHTTSDLQFKAALQDESRMIYTGLIRIGKSAQQTNAFQANHNLILSQGARAETIPMLEILADDVQCKHGASIGPIDDEQAFYLMSRGVPRDVAQRLIVMGFIEPIIQQVPFAPLQERLREEIEGNLHSQ